MVENVEVVGIYMQRGTVVIGGRVTPLQETFRVAGEELAFLSRIC